MLIDNRTSPPLFSVVRELATREAGAFEDGVQRLTEFENSRDILPMVEANERVAGAVIAGVLRTPREQLKDPSVRATYTIEVNRALLNYLASMRLYLDHTQARLTRRYGAKSAPMLAFEEATRAAFDGTPAYRVLSKMRNYMQHVGMPVRHLHFSTGLEGGVVGGQIVHTIAVGCDRDAMLEHYREWGRAKAALAGMPATIEIPPLLAAVTADLHAVDATVVKAEAPLLRRIGEGLVGLLAEVGPGVSATVADIQVDGPRTQMKCLVPPVGVLRGLGISTTVVGTP